MIYKEFPTNKGLADFVKCYWWFDNATSQQLDYTILPDGCFDLIVSFQNLKQGKISLTGLWTLPVDVSIPPNTQLFGIRFKPLAADYILQQSIATISNSEITLSANLWNIEQLPFPHFNQITTQLDSTMLALLVSQKAVDERKKNLFNLLYQTHGAQTVAQYSQQVFWTSRQINRYFHDRFGIPLKTYCNILKCFASYKHIKKGDLYPTQNYFDQSHFIKEIKKQTGKKPTDLHANKNDRFLQLATLREK